MAINTNQNSQMKTIEIIDEDNNVIYFEEVKESNYARRLRSYKLTAELKSRDENKKYTARERPDPVVDVQPESETGTDNPSTDPGTTDSIGTTGTTGRVS